MNPPGQWQKNNNGIIYIARGYALYGSVTKKDDKWYWEARTMHDSRINGVKPTGIEDTKEDAKTLVERHLRESNTCEFST